MTLKKDNHPNQDFFIADIFDNTPFKDDMASMEHPIFVLSKNKDMRNLEYRRDNVSVTIKPTTDGLPTIFDKDVLLYCISLLMQESNAGRVPPKTLRVSSHDLLVATNRQTNDGGYKRLKKALDRLTGVKIKTNIKTGKREQTDVFGMLDGYSIIESSRIKDRMIRLEITLSDWVYNSVLGNEVLTINRDYFRLGKPLERRLYEIARKHCGNQQSWAIGLDKLMEKTGSQSTFRLFRSFIKAIAEDNHLPDYALALDDADKVTFIRKDSGKDNPQGVLALDAMPRISATTLDKARRIVLDAGTGWDFYAIQEQFTLSLIDGFQPKNANGAFINFVKKKVATSP
jgi:plasmid replication initiation protein